MAVRSKLHSSLTLAVGSVFQVSSCTPPRLSPALLVQPAGAPAATLPTGMVTIPTFKRLRDAAAVLPLSRMLVETGEFSLKWQWPFSWSLPLVSPWPDAPDQPPRGITEESARDFAAAVAAAKSRAVAVEAAATTLGTLGYQPLMSKEREEKGAEEEAKDESRGAPAGSGDSTAGPFKRPTIATEPAHVWPVMAELSRMKGIPLCEVLETTAANARAVFAWQYQSEDKA